MTESWRFVLVGDPVDHSRSPAIHNAAMADLGMTGRYETLKADTKVLDSVLVDLRTGRLSGVNITMPLKLAAAQRCQILTTAASRSGSVNTLRYVDGKIEGDSSDVFAAGLILERPDFSDSPILVLGAGGAAAAVVAAAIERTIVVSARDLTRVDLIDGVSDVVPFGQPVDGAIVINATPLGMRGETIPESVVRAGTALVDLAYGPMETPAVSLARDLGMPVCDGLEFLAVQAARSFEWWTGRRAPIETMVRAARNH